MTDQRIEALEAQVKALLAWKLVVEGFMGGLAVADGEPVSAFEAKHRTFVDELRSGKAGV